MFLTDAFAFPCRSLMCGNRTFVEPLTFMVELVR